MKSKFLSLLMGVGIISAFTLAFKPHVDVYNADTKNSKLEWYATKVTGKHNGTVDLKEGKLSNDHGRLSSSFVVDMTSIKSVDLTGEYATKIEGHLKSDDFFSVEKFPTAQFVSTSITALSAPDKDGNTHTVNGNLTIGDISNPISFSAKIVQADGKMNCEGSMIIDRSKYDVRYGSKTFFKDIGDKAIHDEFTIKFNIVAYK